jgi:hypothetical protein
MKTIITLSIVLFNLNVSAQEITGTDLLNKAIAYHDPSGHWGTFNGKLYIDMEVPNKPTRHSVVTLSNNEEFFGLEVTKDDTYINRKWANGECTFALNGLDEITEAQRKEHGLTCDRTVMYKNYYTYLYGLPMKLKDNGTIVHSVVERVNAFDSEYLKLKVTYDPEVGKDTWYFYFNSDTYALEVYQFFHDETKNDGEYILLKNLQTINDIKMPKVRTWYRNNNNELLGTDILVKGEDL